MGRVTGDGTARDNAKPMGKPDYRDPASRCRGSGLRMVPLTYEIRKITEEDRAKWNRFADHAEARGDLEEAQSWRNGIIEWEREQGDTGENGLCRLRPRPATNLGRRSTTSSQVGCAQLGHGAQPEDANPCARSRPLGDWPALLPLCVSVPSDKNHPRFTTSSSIAGRSSGGESMHDGLDGPLPELQRRFLEK